MNNTVLISIIIPVYNVEGYLRECLDSILAQTFNDFEVICVDDGSTDKSLDILNEYAQKDSRFVIVHQENKGAGSARNAGIKLAKGKYVQFLDSDDYFEPTMLEELYNHAEKYNADMTVCSARKVDENKNIIESQNPNSPINLDLAPMETPFSWVDFKDDIFTMFNVAIWNKLFSKDLIKKNNLEFQNLSSCNDVSFGNISKICAKKIVIFNKELVNYRFHRKGNISANRVKHAQNIILAFLKIKEFLQKQNLYKTLKNSYIKAGKMHIFWEIGNCDDLEYKNFTKKLKELMPEDWEFFKPVLRKEFLTLEYLNNFIGSKKVMLWGASLFIQKVLSFEKTQNPNILGLVDRNKAVWGKMCGNYKIYSPDDIKTIAPEGVLLTVLSNHEAIYESIKKEFKEKYPNVELLPNIFMEGL